MITYQISTDNYNIYFYKNKYIHRPNDRLGYNNYLSREYRSNDKYHRENNQIVYIVDCKYHRENNQIAYIDNQVNIHYKCLCGVMIAANSLPESAT